MRTQAERESWEQVVASYVNHKGSRQHMVTTLKLLADFLRKDLLPKSGREFVADLLERIASGDKRSLLPPASQPKSFNAVAVLVAVEKEKEKRGLQKANSQIFERVGTKFGLKPGSVSKEASKGRGYVKAAMREYLRKGDNRDEVISLMSEAIGLSKSAVGKLLSA
ncbi:hypothetical protein FKO01_05040 [Mesorhizobium sp. B2-3-3]|nr:hypothetical protein FKO01_05040 [Mesorhizobium sp. B2-3-3]